MLRIAQEALQNALRHARREHVAVRLRRPTARLVLEVADDGAGFDPRAPELRSRRLGLTSMEERARRLGGRLEIRSAPGAGHDGPPGGRRLAEPIRVLVVDDHAVVREGLRAFLELQDGIEVVGRGGRRRGGDRRRPRSSRPDVVLMDLVMPRLDGVGAMRAAARAQLPQRA